MGRKGSTSCRYDDAGDKAGGDQAVGEDDDELGELTGIEETNILFKKRYMTLYSFGKFFDKSNENS